MATYKLLTELVDGQMNRAEGAPTDLLLYQILVYAVLCGAVVATVTVLGASIECFLVRGYDIRKGTQEVDGRTGRIRYSTDFDMSSWCESPLLQMS